MDDSHRAPQSYAARLREEARLQALRTLAEAPEYTATDVLLRAALREQGLSIGMDAVRVELFWLNENGLVVTQRVGGPAGLMMATLTERGLDIANGTSQVPGVARPRPVA